jgi:DNA-binding SARP family transcriptional activator/tetratricopeptide (TPR) repeat protein
VEVRLLGPFEVVVDGHPVDLTTGRLRTLLAVLAMSAGRSVSLDRLADALWGDDQPADPRRSVQLYVARLRSALGSAAIATERPGYVLRTEPDNVDALRFLRLLDTVDRVRLAEALALWRGTPFDGIPAGWLTTTQRPRLVEHYLAAVERRADLDLAEGRHQQLIPELTELTAQHPLRESLWVRLLVALDRTGRQAEALEQYETIRGRLADRLGIDPGPELRQAYADLLAGSPVAGNAGPPPPPVPRQLPPDIDSFTGRQTALKALNDLLGSVADRGVGPVVISAIAGTAGVGKTTLAVHWAHQIAGQFPDGQLYANLRGFAPAGAPMAAAEVLRGFLDALDVPAQRIPTDPAAQTGLYRSMLAGRRMLIVLDNVRDADQVRPLLPGSPGCLVVVTSRHQLTSLVATEAARPVALDLMPDDEARELLARRLGPARVAAEPAAVDTIIASCARLPLALAVAAARAATNPEFPLAALADELREAGACLDTFDDADPMTNVRSVFSWSYRALTPPAARLFRLFGVVAGPDLGMAAAASLAGITLPQSRMLLAELCRAHLFTEHAPARYGCHDLLRAYATELTHADDSEADRQAAIRRLLDHYLHTARAALRAFSPGREPIAVAPPQEGVLVESFVDLDSALAWFDTEHANLTATVDQAVSTGHDTHAWQLALTVSDFLDRGGHWQDWIRTQRAGLAAARRLADRLALAHTHHELGRAYALLDYPDGDPESELRQALDLYHELDDALGQARTHLTLSVVAEQRGERRTSLHHSERALALCRAAGHRAGEATALNSVGWDHATLGDHPAALRYLRQAITIQQELGDRAGEANTWDSLGYVHRELGEHPAAVECYRRAVVLFRDSGSRTWQADTLVNLGDTHLAEGEPGAARTAWRQALSIYEDLDSPRAGELRARLSGGAWSDRAVSAAGGGG